MGEAWRSQQLTDGLRGICKSTGCEILPSFKENGQEDVMFFLTDG